MHQIKALALRQAAKRTPCSTSPAAANIPAHQQCEAVAAGVQEAAHQASAEGVASAAQQRQLAAQGSERLQGTAAGWGEGCPLRLHASGVQAGGGGNRAPVACSILTRLRAHLQRQSRGAGAPTRLAMHSDPQPRHSGLGLSTLASGLSSSRPLSSAGTSRTYTECGPNGASKMSCASAPGSLLADPSAIRRVRPSPRACSGCQWGCGAVLRSDRGRPAVRCGADRQQQASRAARPCSSCWQYCTAAKQWQTTGP